MGVGGQVVHLIAQGQFDWAEDLVVGQVGEGVGHLGQGPLEQGSEALTQGLEAGFAVKGGRVRVVMLWTGHAGAPALRENDPDALTGQRRSYPQGRCFAPKIVKRYRR
jgi:hypothetical protein